MSLSSRELIIDNVRLPESEEDREATLCACSFNAGIEIESSLRHYFPYPLSTPPFSFPPPFCPCPPCPPLSNPSPLLPSFSLRCPWGFGVWATCPWGSGVTETDLPALVLSSTSLVQPHMELNVAATTNGEMLFSMPNGRKPPISAWRKKSRISALRQPHIVHFYGHVEGS